MFTRMAFVPANGLEDKAAYVTTPESEDAARAQIQGVLNQLKDGLNSLMLAMESATTGSSGAENIGSAAIESVAGTTIREQIINLKEQIDDISAGSVADGAITSAKMADGSITAAKFNPDVYKVMPSLNGAASAITENQNLNDFVDHGTYICQTNAISNTIINSPVLGVAFKLIVDHVLGLSAYIIQRIFGYNGPKHERYSLDGGATWSTWEYQGVANGAITEAKVASGAITETKLGTAAVTSTKIANNAVTISKISNGSVSSEKLTQNAVVTNAITNGSVTKAKLHADALEWVEITADQQLGSSGSVAISSLAGYSEVMLQIKGGTGNNAVNGFGIVPLTSAGVGNPTSFRVPIFTSSDSTYKARVFTLTSATSIGYTITPDPNAQYLSVFAR